MYAIVLLLKYYYYYYYVLMMKTVDAGSAGPGRPRGEARTGRRVRASSCARLRIVKIVNVRRDIFFCIFSASTRTFAVVKSSIIGPYDDSYRVSVGTNYTVIYIYLYLVLKIKEVIISLVTVKNTYKKK